MPGIFLDALKLNSYSAGVFLDALMRPTLSEAPFHVESVSKISDRLTFVLLVFSVVRKA
jgi:hypothetical protein